MILCIHHFKGSCKSGLGSHHVARYVHHSSIHQQLAATRSIHKSHRRVEWSLCHLRLWSFARICTGQLCIQVTFSAFFDNLIYKLVYNQRRGRKQIFGYFVLMAPHKVTKGDPSKILEKKPLRQKNCIRQDVMRNAHHSVVAFITFYLDFLVVVVVKGRWTRFDWWLTLDAFFRSDAQRAAKQKEAKERELEHAAFSADRIEEGGFPPVSMVKILYHYNSSKAFHVFKFGTTTQVFLSDERRAVGFAALIRKSYFARVGKLFPEPRI